MKPKYYMPLMFTGGDGSKHADAARRRVVAGDEYRIIVLALQTSELLERMLRRRIDLIASVRAQSFQVVEIGTDQGQLAAGHDKALVIGHADHPVRRVLHLDNHALKDSAGHLYILPHHHFCIIQTQNDAFFGFVI